MLPTFCRSEMATMINPKEARLTLGLSQKAMAAACGVHRSTYVKWERGEREPDAAAVRLIEVLLWLRDRRIFHEYIFTFLT